MRFRLVKVHIVKLASIRRWELVCTVQAFASILTFTQTMNASSTATKIYVIVNLTFATTIATIPSMQSKRNVRHFKRFIWPRIAYDSVRIIAVFFATNIFCSLLRRFRSLFSSQFICDGRAMDETYIHVKWTLVLCWRKKNKSKSRAARLPSIQWHSTTSVMRSYFFRPPWVTMRNISTSACSCSTKSLTDRNIHLESHRYENSLIWPVVSK